MNAVTADLDGIRTEFLRQCGPCEFSIPGPCQCPTSDYRPALAALVADVERYRTALNDLVTDCEAMPDEQATALMFAATATRIRLILAGQLP